MLLNMDKLGKRNCIIPSYYHCFRTNCRTVENNLSCQSFCSAEFSTVSEVKDFEKPHFIDNLSSVYGDGHNIDKYPSRNINDLDNIF